MNIKTDQFKWFATSISILLTAAVFSVEKPNIVLILADDMGWGDVGFNGCTDFETPAIDSIAADGVRFTEGYVMAPQCAPSRSALLSGKDQNRILANNNMTLDIVGLPQCRTFADYLKQAGYRTGMVGKWHLGENEGKHPMERGFDSFFGFLGGGSFYYPPGKRDSIANILEAHKPVKVARYLTDEFGDRAVQFIQAQNPEPKIPDPKPFFLYLSFNAPHTPMQAPKEEIAKYTHLKSKHKNRPTYAAMVRVMDHNIGKVLRALERNGLEQNTVVIFLSDNGGPETVNGSDNGPLRGVKGDTLEGGIRVPFAIKWPDVIKPGTTADTPVLSIDLLPTALAAAGAPVPEDLEGENLLPALTGNADYPERALHWFFPLNMRQKEMWWWAVRDGDWKLARFNPRQPGKREAIGLFDLETNPSESEDLTTTYPEIRERLQKLHNTWFDGLPVPFSNIHKTAADAYFEEKAKINRTRNREEK